MPRLCANLKWLFTEHAFLKRFELAARAGFQAVEYASPYEYSPKELRAQLHDCNLKQVLFNTPAGDPGRGGGSGLACVPGRTDEFKEGVKRALEYAVALDCKLVHLMAGIQPPDVTYETALALYGTNLAWAAEHAAAAGVLLVLEPINQYDVPGFFLRTQEQAASVIKAVGRERVGLQFDIYHCQVAQGDVTRRMATLMPVIAHMQIADVPGRHEPGTGELAWDFIFRRIDALGYQGWVGCEYRPIEETEKGLHWRSRYNV